MATKKRKYSQDFSGNSKTDRSFGPGTNVNTIVANYKQTGMFPQPGPMHFGHASSKTYFEACSEIADINSAFEELPSETRAEHGNDPGRWIDALGEAERALEKAALAASERASEPSPDPPPEDSTEAEPEEKVQ